MMNPIILYIIEKIFQPNFFQIKNNENIEK